MIATTPPVTHATIDRQQLEVLQPDRVPPAPTPAPTQRHTEERINARMAELFGWTDYQPANEPLDYSMFTTYLRQRGASVECNSLTDVDGATTYTAEIAIPARHGAEPALLTGGSHDDPYPTAELACCAAFVDLCDSFPEAIDV